MRVVTEGFQATRQLQVRVQRLLLAANRPIHIPTYKRGRGLRKNSSISDPRTGVPSGVTQGRNMRSKYPCSTCPAIHINSRTWLRSSSTHEPSDPPPEIIFAVQRYFRFRMEIRSVFPHQQGQKLIAPEKRKTGRTFPGTGTDATVHSGAARSDSTHGSDYPRLCKPPLSASRQSVRARTHIPPKRSGWDAGTSLQTSPQYPANGSPAVAAEHYRG